jgi:hypothetical protein
VAGAAFVVGGVIGCQHDIVTPFPPGLEPFETNPVPVSVAPYNEKLVTIAVDSSSLHLYGRGYILLPPAVVWPTSKASAPNVALCSTNQQLVTENDEPQYEYSFLVHYVVNNLLTIEWDDRWRFGLVTGTADAPMLAIAKHQKTEGSSFIRLSEGTIQFAATPDPDVTEVAFVEHLDAVSAGDGDLLKNMQHNFDSLVAVAHGGGVAKCP